MIKTLKQAPFDDILVKYQSIFIVWNAQISLKCHGWQLCKTVWTHHPQEMLNINDSKGTECNSLEFNREFWWWFFNKMYYHIEVKRK